MTTPNQPNAPTLATRIPESRPVEGLEYGPSWDEGHAICPRGGTLWGRARVVPEMDLADDADLVKAITTELEPWDHLPPAFHPAVATLLKDGEIRPRIEAGHLQEVLADWAWGRLAARLSERGVDPEGGLPGADVEAALAACHRDPATDRALHRVGEKVVAALEQLDELGQNPSAGQEAHNTIRRAVYLLTSARQELEEARLRHDQGYRESYARLELGAAFLEKVARVVTGLGSEALGVALPEAKRLVEPVWLDLGKLE